MTSNIILSDELEAVNSIYNADTLVITSVDNSSTATILKLPNSPFSFSVTFPHAYPNVPPQINGTQSTGPHTKKGEGESALNILRDILGSSYIPGQVCLFDLIEEVTPLLQRSDQASHADAAASQQQTQNGPSQDPHETPTMHRSDTTTPAAPIVPPDLSSLNVKDQSDDPSVPEPNWALSQPILVSKSSFVARAARVDSLGDATNAVGHLLRTNKKVASATHNILAWRIRWRPAPDAQEVVLQDSDDDGETAAGGRLLHLMQLMDVWNVVVVVTRWYGGVKMGPDRFRCINMVARDALVKGGFAKDEVEGTVKGKGKKK